VSRPVPELTISVRFESEPVLRFAAFTDGDLERLKLWLRESGVLLDLSEDLLLLVEGLWLEAEEEAEA
jgi:hypothetical protein